MKSKAKKYLNRQTKRKALVKALFKDYLKEFNLEDKNIKLRVVYKLASSCRGSKVHIRGNSITQKVESANITLDIRDINIFVHYGLNGYYEGRKQAINPYILNNRHNTIRVIILHELKHVIDYIENINTISWNIAKKEKRADNFAIEHIKEHIENKNLDKILCSMFKK